jgi:hypothetical protein
LQRIPMLSLCLALAMIFAILISAWRRSTRAQGHATLSDHDVNAEMRLRAEQAVEAAARDFNAALDYSPDSVEKVEEILGEIHDWHRREPLTESALINSTVTDSS